jgi:hypothetical protein
MRPARATVLALLALLPLLAACELREITVAIPADVVVAEVVLRAGATTQTAYLHRTAMGDGTARVFDARVVVYDVARDLELQFHADADSLCLQPAPPGPLASTGTCYVARVQSDAVRPGARYSLHIELSDRAPLQAATTVPGDFAITRPAAASCRLAPGTGIELAWTGSTGAWVYVAEARFAGLVASLRAAGADLPADIPEPVDLLGLAIGATDTTMAFPGAFGLFDRFDAGVHPLLLALRDGVPPGVDAAVTVAAADRNYVNWVRGGSFNPSGTVRVPSVSGGGTGVFGSLVMRTVRLHTGGGDDVICQ